MEIKDIIRNRRIEMGLTMKQVAEAVGVNEGTVSRWESGNIEKRRGDKIAARSKLLSIDERVIKGGQMQTESENAVDNPQHHEYYTNPETAKVAQQIFDDPDLHALFDAARDSKPEALKAAAVLLKTLKGTNPDG